MKTIQIGESTWELKNEFHDMNMGEFSDMIKTFSDSKLNEVEQWVKVISLLSGIDEETIYMLPKSKFFDIMKSFTNNRLEDNYIYTWENGENQYVAEDELLAGDISKMQSINKANSNVILLTLAVLYKKVGNNFKQHYDDKHLFKNIEDLRLMPASIGIPMINKSFNELTEDVNQLLESKLSQNEVNTINTNTGS